MNLRFTNQARSLRLLHLLLSLAIPLLLSDCAEVYTLPPFGSQILSVRRGHDGKLTSQTCASRDLLGKCTNWNIQEYEISDGNFRKTANKLGIVCNIGGKRYHLCDDLPGFCSNHYECKRWLGICTGTEKQVDYINSAPYEFLIQANVRCFNDQIYPFGG